jgi:hypothetical protein
MHAYGHKHTHTHTHSFYRALRAFIAAILFVAWLGQVLEAVEMSWEGVERHQVYTGNQSLSGKEATGQWT